MLRYLPLLLLLLSGCATYQNRIAEARQDLLQNRCDPAVKTFSELGDKNDGDKLLYLMEEGSALQICGRYEDSNIVLISADKLSEQVDYYSVSRITGATLLNEEMIQYKGDSFENLFINATTALNYIQLNQLDEALVEVRRIDEKYNKLANEEKNSYELNSFAQYLSGLLWEKTGHFDDACISYKNSYKLDSTYRQVGLDLLSACWRAHRRMDYKEMTDLIHPSDDETKAIKAKKKNEIVLVYLQGLGPRKAMVPGDQIYPHLLPTPNKIKKISVSYIKKNGEQGETKSQGIYSVEKAAIATLEADSTALAARRVGARVAKEVLADQIRQKDKALGNIAWLVMVASERPDLRNWTLLPESVQVVRVDAAPDSKIEIAALDQNGDVVESLAPIDLSIKPRQKIYLLRTIK